MSTTKVHRLPTSDLDLRRRVEAELERDNDIPAAAIGVAVTEFAVLLYGSIESETTRHRAVRAASNVCSDRVVVDALWASNDDPTPYVDRQMVRDLGEVIALDTSLPEDLRVVVRAGVVTVTGTASSACQRSHVYQLLSRVPAVRWIQNDLVVGSDIDT